jgi:hypothetical protein
MAERSKYRPEDIDLVKLDAEATEALLTQPANVRNKLLDLVKRPDVDIDLTEDDDLYLRLSVGGISFARVHPSRVSKETATPWWE